MTRRDFILASSGLLAGPGLGVAAEIAPLAPAGEKPLVSFGLLTDVQYADVPPEGERHYRESIPKLRDAVADLAGQGLPFSLHLGDLIDRKHSSLKTVLPLFGGLGHPVRHLLGNHDYSVEDAEKKRVPVELGMPSDYYAFSTSGVRFVMLDTNDISTYKHAEGSPEDVAAEAELAKIRETGARNAKPWNGGLSATQSRWLEQQLAEADQAGDPVIVCGHHPLLPADGHELWGSGGPQALLLRHPSVRAYLCGHNHAGAEVIVDGLPFITFKSILHEPGVNAYAVVRLYRDRLVIEGRGREKSRVIQLRKFR